MTASSIERATPADREVVVTLLAAQFVGHRIELDRERLFAVVDGALFHPERGLFLKLSLDGRVVGFAYLAFTWTLEHGGRSAWLEELYVLSEHRSRGFGRHLPLAVCDEAARAGCLAIDLEVEEDHARAARLYEREGFRAHTRARWFRKLTP